MGSPAIGNRVPARGRPGATAASTKVVVRCRARYHIPPGPVAGISWDTARAPAAYASGAGPMQRGHLATRTRRRPRPGRQQEGCVPHAVNDLSLSGQPVRDACAGSSVWPHCPARKCSLQGDADRCCAQDDPAQQHVAARLPQHSAITPMTSWPGFSSGHARLTRAPCRWHGIRRAVRRPGRSCGHRCLHGRSFRAALAVGLGEVGGRTLIVLPLLNVGVDDLAGPPRPCRNRLPCCCPRGSDQRWPGGGAACPDSDRGSARCCRPGCLVWR